MDEAEVVVYESLTNCKAIRLSADQVGSVTTDGKDVLIAFKSGRVDRLACRNEQEATENCEHINRQLRELTKEQS